MVRAHGSFLERLCPCCGRCATMLSFHENCPTGFWCTRMNVIQSARYNEMIRELDAETESKKRKKD
jgi:hypothetical protein